jgi:zinc protease
MPNASRGTLLLASLTVASLMACASPALAAERVPPPQGSYAIVVSAKTCADEAWRPVVDALQKKYAGRAITWQANVREAQDDLAACMPNYTCFVAQPAECGRDFVVAVHRMTRRLDDDPYTDTIWGILTGYTAEDALRLAQQQEPLILRKVLSGTSGGLLGAFDEGVQFDEGKAGGMRLKSADGKVQDKGCPPDSTRSIVDYFNNEKPDCFITSGHATQHDWQIGYSFKGGQLRHKDGHLFGLDTQGTRYDILSPNPKVCLPVGNCLIGDVSGRDCMVTALVHSAGVIQMFGYTVPTWYGKGGWGIQEYYLGQPGRFTLAEAFFANTQALLHEIQMRFPKIAKVDFEQYDLEKSRRLLDDLSARHGIGGRDELGLLWDRDTVAFYGDPAWQARPAERKLAWDQTLAVEGNRCTFTLTANEGGTWPDKPLVALLPRRVTNARVVKGEDLKPVVTENFILVPMKGQFQPGERTEIVVEADEAIHAPRVVRGP